jgi:cation diffusion facilitator family transporter
VATRFELEDIARRHDFLGVAHDRNARRTLWVVALTSVMMVGEIVAGTLTGSMALLADGFHMATHAGALGVAAAAYAYAKRHVANPHYTWGTGKVGDLAGFASALILGVIALAIAVESASRLLQPVRIDFGDATLIAVVGLLVNIASAALLSHDHGHEHAHDHDHDHADAHHDHEHHDHDHADAHHDHEHHDHNIRAAYIHVLADALTSVLAIVALLSGRYLGWAWLDPVMGIVGALVISSWSWTLIRQTAAVLLDTANDRLIDQIRAAVELSGSAQITDLHVWRVGPGAHAAIVSVAGDADPEVIRTRLLGLCGLAHLTVETHASA